MQTHEDFIKIAIECAENTVKNGGYPFGAIIVKNSSVVGRSDKQCKEFDSTAHAEITAIRDACQNLKTCDLTGCIIYSSCLPCQMCQGAIKWANIKEIYFAMDKNDAKAIGYFDEIFTDDTFNLTEHKINNSGLLNFMNNWYKNNSIQQ